MRLFWPRSRMKNNFHYHTDEIFFFICGAVRCALYRMSSEVFGDCIWPPQGIVSSPGLPHPNLSSHFSQRVGMFSHSDALIPSYPLSTIFTNIFHTITVTEVVCICGPPKASRGDVILTLIITSTNQPLSTVSWNILHRVAQVAPFSILILSEQKYFGTEFFWHRK